MNRSTSKTHVEHAIHVLNRKKVDRFTYIDENEMREAMNINTNIYTKDNFRCNKHVHSTFGLVHLSYKEITLFDFNEIHWNKFFFGKWTDIIDRQGV